MLVLFALDALVILSITFSYLFQRSTDMALYYVAVNPPSTIITLPVIHVDSSPAKNSIA